MPLVAARIRAQDSEGIQDLQAARTFASCLSCTPVVPPRDLTGIHEEGRA